jgi:hypothetical protein
MPKQMPEVEDRMSHAAKDRSPSSDFNDSVALPTNTNGSGSLNDVAMHASGALT